MSKPKTAERWFALDDLPTELGRVFTPEKEWKHDISNTYEHCEMNCFACTKCHKCIENLSHKYISGVPGRTVYSSDEPCSVPDPIDTEDWKVAMEWRDRCVEKCGARKFRDAMRKVAMYQTNTEPATAHLQRQFGANWFSVYAQPKHYLIAAAMAAER